MDAIDFFPPRRAMIDHILSNGEVTRIECEVHTEYDDATFWIIYSDPEDDNAAIADAVSGSELKFIDDTARAAQEGAERSAQEKDGA